MTEKLKVNEGNLYPLLVAASLAVSVAAALACAFLVSGRFSLSLLAGGLLATGNLIWLRRGLVALLQGETGQAARKALAKYLLRLATMGFILYLLIVKFHADVIGLVLGLSILVVTLTVCTLYISTRKGG